MNHEVTHNMSQTMSEGRFTCRETSNSIDSISFNLVEAQGWEQYQFIMSWSLSVVAHCKMFGDGLFTPVRGFPDAADRDRVTAAFSPLLFVEI